MSFVGEVNRLGSAWVRPHELEVAQEPAADAVEALIERITPYGFDARVELALADGETVTAQMTRERLELLELERGQIVWIRAVAEQVFEERAPASV
jgi:sulfate transport system ATP-binding protein